VGLLAGVVISGADLRSRAAAGLVGLSEPLLRAIFQAPPGAVRGHVAPTVPAQVDTWAATATPALVQAIPAAPDSSPLQSGPAMVSGAVAGTLSSEASVDKPAATVEPTTAAGAPPDGGPSAQLIGGREDAPTPSPAPTPGSPATLDAPSDIAATPAAGAPSEVAATPVGGPAPVANAVTSPATPRPPAAPAQPVSTLRPGAGVSGQAPPATGPRPQSHVVAPGDTVWSIAQRYSTTVDAIVDRNGLQNKERILVGQQLAIPR
jgi:LysM repeat protein